MNHDPNVDLASRARSLYSERRVYASLLIRDSKSREHLPLFAELIVNFATLYFRAVYQEFGLRLLLHSVAKVDSTVE